ncbi:hypothetical protein [Arcicella aurantiaca]|nr:hypothetical protein [Arcicella aurantiaca]
MPRRVGNIIADLMQQGQVCPELEECYRIIREECPTYQHLDNSNARKMLTGRKINNIIRKLPVSAYVQILDKLGIASGKFLPGR